MPNQYPLYMGPSGAGPYNALHRKTANDRMVGLVNEEDYQAFSILAAAVAGQPVPLVVPASTFVGRLSSGDVTAMTAAQARAILNVADGAEALAGTQLGTGADVWKDVVASAMRFRSLISSTPAYLTITENADDITFTILPAAFTLGAAGDVNLAGGSGSLSVGDVLEWDGTDFVPEPNGSGGGIGDIVDDTTPQLGGDLDVNGNAIVSAAGVDVEIAPASGRDVAITTAAGGVLSVNGNPALPVNTGTPAAGDILHYDGVEYVKLALGASSRRLTSDGSDVKWSTDTRYFHRMLTNADVAVDTFGLGYSFQNATAVRVVYWVKGSAPSVTFTIERGPDRGGAGSSTVLTSTVATSTAGVVTATGLTGTIAAGDRLWIDISATGGTVDEFYCAIVFNENP